MRMQRLRETASSKAPPVRDVESRRGGWMGVVERALTDDVARPCVLAEVLGVRLQCVAEAREQRCAALDANHRI